MHDDKRMRIRSLSDYRTWRTEYNGVSKKLMWENHFQPIVLYEVRI
jgi:hypothetical protein